MNWIVVSQELPASLREHLWSGSIYLPTKFPIVVHHETLPAPSPDYYLNLSESFPRMILASGAFRDAMMAAMQHGIAVEEKTTLVALDTIKFCYRPDLRLCSAALDDDVNLLGFDLMRTPHRFCQERYVSGWEYFVTHYAVADDTPSIPPFSFGTVYRTRDLLAAMTQTNWDTPSTMQKALSGCAVFRSHTRIGFLPKQSMDFNVA